MKDDFIISFAAGLLLGLTILASYIILRSFDDQHEIEHTEIIRTVELNLGEVEEEPAAEEEIEYFDLLCHAVEAEAGNQDTLGKRLVVDVILNRVDSDKFPNDIKDVIYQDRQFAVVSNGSIDRVTPSRDTEEAVRMELEHRTDDEILFFCSNGFNSTEPAYKHGDHYFGY